MAITIDGKIYRNIQEQVKKNQDDIASLQTIESDVDTKIENVQNELDKKVDKTALAQEVVTGDIVADTVRSVTYLFDKTGESFSLFQSADGEKLGFLTPYNQDENFAFSIDDGRGITAPEVKVADSHTFVAKEAKIESVLTNYLTFKDGTDYGIYSYNYNGEEVKVAEYDTGNTNELKLGVDICLNKFTVDPMQSLIVDGNTREQSVSVLQCTLYYSEPDGEDMCLQFITTDDESMLFYKIGAVDSYTGVWQNLYSNELIQVTEISDNGNVVANTFPKPFYRHTVTFDFYTGMLCFTTDSSKNLVVDSVQDLITLFNGTKISCVGHEDTMNTLIRLDIGATINDCYILDSDNGQKKLSALTIIEIKDDVTAVNTAL